MSKEKEVKERRGYEVKRQEIGGKEKGGEKKDEQQMRGVQTMMKRSKGRRQDTRRRRRRGRTNVGWLQQLPVSHQSGEEHRVSVKWVADKGKSVSSLEHAPENFPLWSTENISQIKKQNCGKNI